MIQARKELGTLASLVAQGLPELAAEWAALPDVAARKGYRTLFAPSALALALIFCGWEGGWMVYRPTNEHQPTKPFTHTYISHTHTYGNRRRGLGGTPR